MISWLWVNGNFYFTLKRSTDDILARGVRDEWWMLTQSAASYTNHHLPATILTHKLPPTQKDKHKDKHKKTNTQTKARTQIATHTEHTNRLSPHLASKIFLVFFTNIFHSSEQCYENTQLRSVHMMNKGSLQMQISSEKRACLGLFFFAYCNELADFFR